MDDKSVVLAAPLGLIGGGLTGAVLGGLIGSKIGHKNIAATIGGGVLGSMALGLAGVIAGSWYGANRAELATLKALEVPSFGDIERTLSAPIAAAPAAVAGVGLVARFP